MVLNVSWAIVSQWTALNTGVNNHQDTLKTQSFKPPVEVVWETFDRISFVM